MTCIVRQNRYENRSQRELAPADIQRLYSELRTSGGRDGTPLSGMQVRNVHRVVHNALNYGVRLGYIARNPTEAIDKPREDSPERTVYTPEQIRRFLLAVEGDRLQAMWYLELRDEHALGDYVFVDEFGHPLHPARLTRDLHSLQRRAGLPEISLHGLRHTAATTALFAGVHPKVVSERHGHSSPQITLHRCSHVLQSMQESARRRSEDFFALMRLR